MIIIFNTIMIYKFRFNLVDNDNHSHLDINDNDNHSHLDLTI